MQALEKKPSKQQPSNEWTIGKQMNRTAIQQQNKTRKVKYKNYKIFMFSIYRYCIYVHVCVCVFFFMKRDVMDVGIAILRPELYNIEKGGMEAFSLWVQTVHVCVWVWVRNAKHPVVGFHADYFRYNHPSTTLAPSPIQNVKKRDVYIVKWSSRSRTGREWRVELVKLLRCSFEMS